MGLNKKNANIPYNHLQGKRQKLRKRYNDEKARAKEENIQFDSSMKLLNSAVMEIKKEKDQFDKNKYKYQEADSSKLGREKEGFLHLTTQDVNRIRGEDNNSFKKKRTLSKNYSKKKPFKKHKH